MSVNLLSGTRTSSSMGSSFSETSSQTVATPISVTVAKDLSGSIATEAFSCGNEVFSAASEAWALTKIVCDALGKVSVESDSNRVSVIIPVAVVGATEAAKAAFKAQDGAQDAAALAAVAKIVKNGTVDTFPLALQVIRSFGRCTADFDPDLYDIAMESVTTTRKAVIFADDVYKIARAADFMAKGAYQIATTAAKAAIATQMVADGAPDATKAIAQVVAAAERSKACFECIQQVNAMMTNCMAKAS